MRLVASAAPVGALLHTLVDAPMTAVAQGLVATVGDDDVSRWDAYFDPSSDDEPYYLYARDRDRWYRIEADAWSVLRERAAASTASTVCTTLHREAHVHLTGSWPAGAKAPAYGFVRVARRANGARITSDAFVSATTVAVIAAAVESLARRLPGRARSLARASGRPSARARGRAVTVRLDG